MAGRRRDADGIEILADSERQKRVGEFWVGMAQAFRPLLRSYELKKTVVLETSARVFLLWEQEIYVTRRLLTC